MAEKKRRNYKQNVLATERDRDLIRFLGEHGCATTAQIAQLYWPGRKVRTCAERLDLLVKAGFLHTTSVYSRGMEEQVYWIQQKGSRIFEKDVRDRFQLGKPAETEIAHILGTNDILYKMNQKGAVKQFTNEHVLKSNKIRSGDEFQVGDAEVQYEVNGKTYTFTIEVDNGHYHGKQLHQKIQDFGTSGKPTLWVVYTKQRLSRLKELCHGYSNIRPVHFESL